MGSLTIACIDGMLKLSCPIQTRGVCVRLCVNPVIARAKT